MVNKKLLLPQEVETYYIIPTIRRTFALLMKEKGMKQNDIAKILNVNKAAISQYTSGKRGNKVEFGEEIMEEIKTSANNITTTYDYIKETQRILKVIKEKRSLCGIHKKFCVIPEGCTPETTGCHDTGICESCKI
ncbi:MAG: helix-turn-helix domain-containing protein [Nanoarchaeota archaeon]|nr:helix-turn-helix domain-containing protein [Nanoarchaeota archaeon]